MVRNIKITNLAQVKAARAARPDVMKPQKVGSKWHMPKMKALAVARRRKQVIQSGQEWKWDIPHKIVEKRVKFKGHLRDLRNAERKKEIERCMKRMPKLVAEYREKRRNKKKESKGLLQLLYKEEEVKEEVRWRMGGSKARR